MEGERSHHYTNPAPLLAEFFLIFPVSSSVCNKRIFIKKYGVTGLVFKIDAINGKKWVKYVAMHDLNAMKGTMES